MKKSHSYIPVIEAWENYLLETDNPQLDQFADWIKRNVIPVAPQNHEFESYFEKHTLENNNKIHTAKAGFFIGRLFKYVKFYTKPVFAKVGLGSLDEFGILGSIDEKGQVSKKELIQENLLEFTTGSDILKRLIIHGLIKEKINPLDKREKLVSITAKGKKTLYATYYELSGIPDVLADLELEKRESLIGVFSHLDKFHKRIVDAATIPSK